MVDKHEIEVKLVLAHTPRFHRLAFWYTWNGFRTPQILWRVARILKKDPPSGTVRLPNGFPLIIDEKDWISKTIYEGTYERALLHFLDSLELSDLVLDVGANIGVTLWHSLKNANVHTQYLAFEPSSQCLDGLRLTTSYTNKEGSILNFAIGESNEVRTIYGVDNHAHSGGASFIQHPGLRGHSEKIQVRTLDSIFEDRDPKSKVSLLKIDTEGFEAQVISGASKLLVSQQIEILVIEVSPNFGDVEYLNDIHQYLGSNYFWFSLDEAGFIKRRPYLRGISLEESLQLSIQWNLVLIHQDVFHKYISQGHKYIK